MLVRVSMLRRASLAPPRSGGERGAGAGGSRDLHLPSWAAWVTIPPAVGASVLAAAAAHPLIALGFVAGGVVALLLAKLALFRFFHFVLALLVLRASLGITGRGGGTGALDLTSLASLAFMAPALLWLLARRWRTHAANLPLRAATMAFLAAGLLSTIGSERPMTSLVGLVQLASWVLMFLVLDELIETRRDILQLLGAVGLSAVVPLTLGLVGAVRGASGPLVEITGTLPRVTSTFAGSNSFGRYLMLLLLMAWAIQPFLPRTQRRAVLMGTVPATILLALTYTRSAWLGLIVGLAVIGLLQSRRLLVGLVVVSTVLLLAVQPVSDRLFTTASPYETAEGTISWRLSYWQEILPLAGQQPVTGIGLGVTRFQTEEGKSPHNDYLRFLVETGVVGLTAYLGFLLALLAVAVRAVRRRPPSLMRGVGVGFAGCVVATLAVTAGANVVLNVAYMWYLMAFAAATTAAIRRQDEPSTPSGTPSTGAAGENAKRLRRARARGSTGIQPA